MAWPLRSSWPPRVFFALAGVLAVALAVAPQLAFPPSAEPAASPVPTAPPVVTPSAPAPPPPVPAFPMRGVCWEGQRRRIADDALRPLEELGADWVSQTPYGWLRALDDPHVRLAGGQHAWWGESDAGLIETARLARASGLRTLLKPHLWVRGGRWVGEVRLRSEADWRTFFRTYEVFILHYARLAEREGFEALAVGTELSHASRRAGDWRRVIARVRAVYRGPLTYCASWNEAERVEFWDALDFVGVQAYYPLAEGDGRPTPGALRAAWLPIAERLAALARRTGRRVVFTEVGYKSVAGALREPWAWDTRGDVDLALQRDAFRAMFDSLWGRDWFGGTFVWKWHPDVGWPPSPPRRYERDFTPQGKPALEVIREVYTRVAPAAQDRRPLPP